jgi:hypothetical protein
MVFLVYITNVSISDYIASDDMMISEWWIGKDLEGGGHCLIEASTWICLEEQIKITKTLRIAGVRAKVRTFLDYKPKTLSQRHVCSV